MLSTCRLVYMAVFLTIGKFILQAHAFWRPPSPSWNDAGSTSKSYPASYDKVTSVAAVASKQEEVPFRRGITKWICRCSSLPTHWATGMLTSGKGSPPPMPGVERYFVKIWVSRAMLQQTVGECLLSTAEDLGAVCGRDNDYGVGLLQTSECHDCLMDVSARAPSPVPTPKSLPQVPTPAAPPSCSGLFFFRVCTKV
jgi:hypothetical protein